jgi:hypothetical protein
MELHLERMKVAIKMNSKTGKNAKFITLPIMHNPKHIDYEL